MTLDLDALEARANVPELVAEVRRLLRALVEIDTHLAHDPEVWRLVSAAKAGEVLCNVLGMDTIRRINATARMTEEIWSRSL